MSAHPDTRPPAVGESGNDMLRPFAAFVGVLVVVGVLLVVGALAQDTAPGGGSTPGGIGGASASPGAPVDAAAYLDPAAPEAPTLDLVDPDGRPFSLTSQLGHPVLVFFGYTHCPDVCPTTIGTVGKVLREVGWGTTAVFASIDPERDTPAWLKDWVEFLPAGFNAVTGTPDQVRATADDWGVQYARVDTAGGADAYSMAHTADVYLIDADGRLRATFPYGTGPETMMAALREVVSTPATGGAAAPSAALASPATPVPASPVPSQATPSGAPAAGASPSPVAAALPLGVEILSSSVWAGGQSPVVLGLRSEAARIADTSLAPTVQLTTTDGTKVGAPVTAVAVKPEGVEDVSYVATIDVPSAGSWRLQVEADLEAGQAFGSSPMTVLDPGSTARLGSQAPTIRTPTLADVGGDAKQITTDPAPDLRLSSRSTADALAEGKPFVLVLDSTRFKVSPACGRAIILVRFLLDRWNDVDFIHHEPYVYSVVTEMPVIEGDLSNPTLTEVSQAWGIGDAPWGAKTMPWIFVVDGKGVVRAKYQGVVGTDDVDVILSLIAQEG